jgi:lysozyme
VNLRQQLIRDEGDKPSVYADHLGFQTIGVGFLVDARKGGKLPPAVRDFWLDYLITERRAALNAALPWFKTLDPVRQDALLNMAYQLGVGGLLDFKTTLARIRDQRYDDAANSMMDSLWARQTPARAKRLALQISSGAYQ